MKKLISIAGSALLIGLAGSASAQSIESVTMTSDPDDVVFTLRADKPLSTPNVRTYEGSVRLRFASSDAPQSIQVKGDGAAIKLVDVRSGSHGTAVMKLDLGDNTKLTDADVRVENRKHIAVVRIARDLLPPMREAQPAAPVEKPAAAPAPVAAAPAAEPAVQQPKLLEQKKPILPVEKPKKELNDVLAQNTGSSPVPMLIAVSAVLALAYFVMRMVIAKNKGASPKLAAIDIVAQKRIGPRHQLMIVRAFGREHLLSIQGGTTTPIATSEELFEESFGRNESQLDLTASQQRMLPAMSETRKVEEKETPFGGELLRAALNQRLKDQGVVAQSESRTSSSMPAPKSQPVPRSQPFPSETHGGNGQSKDDKALSTAVAGLVRLRREAQL